MRTYGKDAGRCANNNISVNVEINAEPSSFAFHLDTADFYSRAIKYERVIFHSLMRPSNWKLLIKDELDRASFCCELSAGYKYALLN